MITVIRIAELRERCDAARRAGRSVGLVPTMGFLHDGHRALMRAARASTGFVITSVFVNPTQFGPAEDLDAYPRDLDRDRGVARSEGVDLVFAPTVAEMYPEGTTRTTVHVAGLTEGLCGASRPWHFDGVTTVVTKLFAIVGPCRAFFGEKDYQQLAVVRQMARDLDLPVEVIGCPTVRERDGVALSSRNAYLSADERAAATVLYRALGAARDAARAGQQRAATLERIVRDTVGREPLVALEYAEVRDAQDLRRVDDLVGPVVLAVAARVGPARLIDNVVICPEEEDVTHPDAVTNPEERTPTLSEERTPCAAR